MEKDIETVMWTDTKSKMSGEYDYGACNGKQCPENDCDALFRDYKFYLAFENTLCHEYVTEKFFKCYKLVS